MSEINQNNNLNETLKSSAYGGLSSHSEEPQQSGVDPASLELQTRKRFSLAQKKIIRKNSFSPVLDSAP